MIRSRKATENDSSPRSVGAVWSSEGRAACGLCRVTTNMFCVAENWGYAPIKKELYFNEPIGEIKMMYEERSDLTKGTYIEI
ncbi:MAG: hypothetical protein MJ010_07275 [Paludibacteraceae bacterium]|nr:hypothetical protein [Paludibacteraceae bacterium]